MQGWMNTDESHLSQPFVTSPSNVSNTSGNSNLNPQTLRAAQRRLGTPACTLPRRISVGACRSGLHTLSIRFWGVADAIFSAAP